LGFVEQRTTSEKRSNSMNEVSKNDQKMDESKNGKRTKRRRRLLKHRMYRCGDGEYFWYFTKWDGEGNVVGKVYDPRYDCLRNKVVHRSLLEDAQLVGIGDEPWVPGE
jgi:hypothetical protein